MMQSPDPGAILAAELRVIAARERAVESGRRAWLEMKSALVRPSSLAIAAAAGFFGGLLASRSHATRARSPDKDASATRQSVMSLVLTFALHQATRLIPVIVGRMWREGRSDESCTEVKTAGVHERTG